jgi:hypothetical protein
MATTTNDEQVTKRRVTMRSALLAGMDDKGKPVVSIAEATDYVRPDFLDAYVADAQSRWQSVEVSDEPDAGPGGYHGETTVPEGLNHPLAGQTFPATKPAKKKDA